MKHYNDGGWNFQCRKCPRVDEAWEEKDSGADDYADVDGWPWDAECESCGEYVFPDAVAQVESEHAYYAARYAQARHKPDPEAWFKSDAESVPTPTNDPTDPRTPEYWGLQ